MGEYHKHSYLVMTGLMYEMIKKMIRGVLESVDGSQERCLDFVQGVYDAMREEFTANNPTTTVNTMDFFRAFYAHFRQNPEYAATGTLTDAYELLKNIGYMKPGIDINAFFEAMLEADFLMGLYSASTEMFGVSLDTVEPK